MTPKFVHLHLHSEYSLIDGLVRIKSLIAHCKEKIIATVALTDHCNLFAAIKFYTHALQAGIKPILGAEVAVLNSGDKDKPFKVVILCQTEVGYKHLIQLISKAYVEGQQSGVPLIKRAWLNEFNKGLIVLSGGREGDIGQALLTEKIEQAKNYLSQWLEIFDDRFYIELIRTGRENEERYIEQILPLAHEFKVPVVATNDVRYINPDDFEAHEARVCIHDSYVLEDPQRPRIYSQQQYLRSEMEMQELFKDIPAAIENTVEIAKRCNLLLNLGRVYLPDFPTGKLSMADYLNQQSQRGLNERLQQLFDPNAGEFADVRKQYDERLQMELNVIIKMGFPGYFLIVADFIAWSKANGISVGPGRGSGAGSIVAYALKITDLDPIKHDLLFERFLNPERVSMPDFDVDFCMEGRDRVIDYIAQKYGRQSVSQIITFGTMAAKAVVRDVGRVQGYPYGFVDKIAKLIPFEVGMTLEKALVQEEDLRKRYEHEEEVKELIDLAKKLEGIARNAGKHAGGIVIAPSMLTDFSALYCEPESQQAVTQFDKDDVETVGLVKFDILGLRTLTIIDWTLKTINAHRQQQSEPELDITKISMDDEPTFALLKRCATTGVFQLESRGMKDLIKRLQPDCFEDIVQLGALFRPGPLQSGLVDDFINRKHGRAVFEYAHPSLEPILSSTYGVILYQEQVMRIAQSLAGYTLGGADMLRRAMGKKKPAEMAKQRSIFLEGALKNNIETKTATSIFDLMEKFAGYGFNKSHSAAYAYVSYQTAWLKAHYPAAFMAAVLSSEMQHTDKLVVFIDECKRMQLKVLPPDINHSAYKFTIINDSTILYGLGAIKGAGETAIINMLESRKQQGPYRDLFDLCKRVDSRKVNRRVLEALVCAGALDSLGAHRASLSASIDSALKYAEQQAKDLDSGQVDLFDLSSSTMIHQATPNYVTAAKWNMEQILTAEKSSIGFYFSGHPIDLYEEELKQFISGRIAYLELNQSKSITIAGLLTSVRTMFTKRGNRMAFITVSDQSGVLELAVFSDVYEPKREILQKDNIVIIEAEVNYDENAKVYKLNAKNALSIEQARQTYAKVVFLQVTKQRMKTDFIKNLQQILKPFSQGKCPVQINYLGASASAGIELDTSWWVNPENKLITNLQEFLGVESVKIYY